MRKIKIHWPILTITYILNNSRNYNTKYKHCDKNLWVFFVVTNCTRVPIIIYNSLFHLESKICLYIFQTELIPYIK